MLELRHIMRSVCSISSMVASDGYKAFYREGVGVFIAPDQILTAWHVVKGSQAIAFTNCDGKTAHFRRGPGSRRVEHLDLAIAMLDRPIGREVCIVPDPDSAEVAAFDKGFLLTRFNKMVSHHSVSVDHEENAKAGKPVSLSGQFLNFKAPIDLKHGYSGSPVVSENGFIMTLACMVGIANLDKVIKGKEPERLKEKSFMGPSARDTALFLHNAL